MAGASLPSFTQCTIRVMASSFFDVLQSWHSNIDAADWVSFSLAML